MNILSPEPAQNLHGLATPGLGLANYDAPMTWVEDVSGTTNDLNDVWGTSASNVWVVGDSGTILYYNGNSWTAQQTSVTADLKSIWGRSASDIYAVGTGGTYLHYEDSGDTILFIQTLKGKNEHEFCIMLWKAVSGRRSNLVQECLHGKKKGDRI